jgi:hypothetical protein
LLLQGKYEQLPSRTVKLNLTTSSSGAFILEKPAAAAYFFKSNADTECVDSLTSECCAGFANYMLVASVLAFNNMNVAPLPHPIWVT